MDSEIRNISPDYARIFSEILQKKFPEKTAVFPLLKSKELTQLEVLNLNQSIFGAPTIDTIKFNQKQKAYNKATILEILRYQQKNNLNNLELAKHFNLSRNSITKWKKKFLKIM